MSERGNPAPAWFSSCSSEKIFDTPLRSLKAKWNLLEKNNITANSTGFSLYEWFKFYKVSDSVVIIQTLCTNQINTLNLQNIESENKYIEEL